MSIPAKPTIASEFIKSAPDGAKATASEPPLVEAKKVKGVRKGKRQQITHTIGDDLLERLDSAAQTTGQSRAALINLAIFRMLEAGV
jgi:hypothetical protein